MAKRRPSGDGMVRKKEDGSWEGRVVIGYDEKNLPKTKNVLAKTKSECVEKLKQLQEQYAPPKSDKIKLEMPFGEWMDFWYQNYCKPKLRPTTRSGYEGRIESISNNRDGMALRILAEKLMKAPQNTKLLISISDGQLWAVHR